MTDMKLKDLLNSATTQLRDLSTLDNPDFRLEQAVYKKDEKIWEIVISYLVKNNTITTNPFADIAPAFKYTRLYKKVNLDENGQVAGFYLYDNAE